MKDYKLLSIVVPAHNSERHIEKCLISIRNSDFTDYELIVVNDGSTDRTAEIAKKHADKVISTAKCKGLLAVRLVGFSQCKSPIIVNIDSDVEIKSDSLKIIYDYFHENNDIGALTGMLAIESPIHNFFSTYKNLYMNFVFSKLPERVSFLYGSVFAIRRQTLNLALKALSNRSPFSSSDDSEFGQLLVSIGIKIGFVRQLEVIHNKIYSLRRLLQNDYVIPKSFARLLLHFKQRPRLSFKTPVFLHTSLSQVIAILSAYATVAFVLISPLLSVAFFCFWILSNLNFFYFMLKHRGFQFTTTAIFFTFLDQIVKGLGIASGFLSFILPGKVFNMGVKKQKSISQITPDKSIYISGETL